MGSTHHGGISEDVAQRTANKPKFYEKKDAKRKQLALARQARTSDLLKPKGKQQAPSLRQAPLLPPAKERRTSAVIAEALMAPNKRCVDLASGTGAGRTKFTSRASLPPYKSYHFLFNHVVQSFA